MPKVVSASELAVDGSKEGEIKLVLNKEGKTIAHQVGSRLFEELTDGGSGRLARPAGSSWGRSCLIRRWSTGILRRGQRQSTRG